jgi:hypothetical protein
MEEEIVQNSGSDVLTGLFLVLLALTLIMAGLIFLWFFAKKIREKAMHRRSLNSDIFEIRLPKTSDADAQAADQLFSGLTAISESHKNIFQKLFKTKRSVSFEIVGLPESIRFYVIAPKSISELVEKQIHATHPEADIQRSDEYNIFHEDSRVEFAELVLAEEYYKPIRTYADLHVDTLSSLTASVSRMTEGEGAVIQYVITPADKKWRKKGRSFVSSTKNIDPEKKKSDKSNENEEAIGGVEKKTSKSAFQVDIRIIATAKTTEVAKMHLSNIVACFEPMEMPGGNSFKKKKLKNREKKDFMNDYIYRNGREGTILNTEELATVLHFPNKNIQTPYLHWLWSKRAPAPEEVASSGPGVWLGTSLFRGVNKQVWARDEDRRRHMYIVGKTGSGKSWLLQSMIIQDIRAGKGVAFLDPHGDAAEWVLERIPPERAEDVIYFNPADTERPLGFNMVDFYDEQDKHRVANSFIGLMYKMFDPNKQGIVGPRFERAVRNALLTAMSVKGSTLIETARILYDPAFVRRYMPYVQDQQVREYWEKEIAQTSDFHKSEVLGYIVSKFDRFITNKLMRNIIGQSESSFNFREVMDKGKILIVNLSKGTVGEENAQFLGLILIPKILSAAMSRANIPEADRRDFYLYVDEFQNFATEEFTQILSEARKYRLNLIVANQYIMQIEDKIRDAIFGNVGSIISFKVGVNDGNHMQNEFAPVFSQTDFINLENQNAYVKLLVNNEYPSPFSIRTTFDSIKPTIINGVEYPVNKRVVEMVKELSRLRYGKDAKLIEQEITNRGKL